MNRLEEIFALLPEKQQRQALIGRLELMYANAEWHEIERLLPAILSMQGQERFVVEALLIGIKCAVRLRKINIAFKRYELLSAMQKAADLTDIKINALFFLASQILPFCSNIIFTYWRELASEKMLVEHSELIKIAKLLQEVFRKNSDSHSLEKLDAILTDRFADTK